MYPQSLKTLLGVGLVVLSSSPVWAQSERLQPKKPETPAPATVQKADPATVGLTGSPQDPGPALKGVAILGSREEVKSKGDVAADGVEVGPGSQLDLLRSKEFKVAIQPLIGQPINNYNLGRLQREIILFFRKNHRPLVDVVLPEQESVGNGVVQVFILEGKLGKVEVEGNKYFKSELFTKSISLRQGDVIDSQELLSDLDWMNRNPGRHVDAAFRRGEKLGESDVVLRVKDRFPLRGYVGYENNGPFVAGEDRVFAGFNWFNAFGVDHRLSYQYTTDIEFDLIHAHSVSYEIPLPWRHTISLFGGYVDSEADLPAFAATQKGSSYQASGRYEIPLGRIGNFSHLVNFGIDFKRLDNTLEFSNFPVFGRELDVFQAAVQYRTECTDKWGGTGLKVEGFYSPGDVTANNDNASYQSYVRLRDSSYMYGRLTLERITKLPSDFSWVVRAVGQLASQNIPTTEQLGIGGSIGPRGYDEREANGDSGYLLINEIYSPSLPLFSMINKKAGDNLRFLAFFDLGETQNKDLAPNEDPHLQLMSFGVGMRYQFRTNLSVKFDYGWQLIDSGSPLNNPHSPENSRGHISAILSF
ncbi:MAG TPA: ShlB/FhaC/HecB family hemolysin secretion/activation protein [Verrucomicrobiae bacterium]